LIRPSSTDKARPPKKETATEAKRRINKEAFLKVLADTGNIRLSCQAADVPRASVYEWLAADPTFASRFDVAREEAIEALEAVARNRAIGQRAQYDTNGHQVQAAVHGSDLLVMFLLKSLRPEKYRDNVRVDMSIDVKHEVDRIAADIGAPVDEVMAEVERILAEGKA
jgi:hypothetical protein